MVLFVLYSISKFR